MLYLSADTKENAMETLERTLHLNPRDLCSEKALNAVSEWTNIADQVQSRLVLSLERVDQIDAVGLSALSQLRTICRRRGVALNLVNAPGPVFQLLNRLGLARIFSVSKVPSRAAAPAGQLVSPAAA
jgi:anti-anti-sigma factor